MPYQKIEAWNRADILLVTDGEFPFPENTLEQVNQAKEKFKLKIHGILVGSARKDEMNRLCDEIYTFADWENILESRL
ncbi:MAG: hypothetical protein GQ569_00515 [Methylococcaceae bacterium]|nr:hypothetical protein [Methylococcaceae bacterium]